MANKKQLTFNQVKNDNKKFKEKERIEFDNGEFYLDLCLNFEPLKVKELIEDFSQTVYFAKQNDIDIPSKLVYDFVYCFIIKHFTSIPSPTDPKKLIQGFIDLINSDYYVQIINAFPSDSLEKVFNKILNVIETGSKIENKKAKMAEELNDTVKDETVRKITGLEN